MGLAKSAFKKSTRMLIDLDSTVEATATSPQKTWAKIPTPPPSSIGSPSSDNESTTKVDGKGLLSTVHASSNVVKFTDTLTPPPKKLSPKAPATLRIIVSSRSVSSPAPAKKSSFLIDSDAAAAKMKQKTGENASDAPTVRTVKTSPKKTKTQENAIVDKKSNALPKPLVKQVPVVTRKTKSPRVSPSAKIAKANPSDQQVNDLAPNELAKTNVQNAKITREKTNADPDYGSATAPAAQESSILTPLQQANRARNKKRAEKRAKQKLEARSAVNPESEACKDAQVFDSKSCGKSQATDSKSRKESQPADSESREDVETALKEWRQWLISQEITKITIQGEVKARKHDIANVNNLPHYARRDTQQRKQDTKAHLLELMFALYNKGIYYKLHENEIQLTKAFKVAHGAKLSYEDADDVCAARTAKDACMSACEYSLLRELARKTLDQMGKTHEDLARSGASQAMLSKHNMSPTSNTPSPPPNASPTQTRTILTPSNKSKTPFPTFNFSIP